MCTVWFETQNFVGEWMAEWGAGQATSPRQAPLAGQARRALLLLRLRLRVWHLERRPLAGGCLHRGSQGGWL